MTALFTIIAAIVVKYLVDVVKIIGAWLDKVTPTFPAWVKNLFPLWKLLAAIAVTVLVVWGTTKFKVELAHPLAVLVLAQVAHEIASAVKKARNNAENTPS